MIVLNVLEDRSAWIREASAERGKLGLIKDDVEHWDQVVTNETADFESVSSQQLTFRPASNPPAA